MYEVQPIRTGDLSTLKPLLDASAGYCCDLEDELEYFTEEKPQNWHWLACNGQALGFVRDFPQDEAWGVGEIYASPGPNQTTILSQLIRQFLDETTYPKGFRLRFDVTADQHLVVDGLKKFGFSDKIETFLHYEKQPGPTTEGLPESAQAKDLKEACEALKSLHSPITSQVASWIKEKSVLVLRSQETISSMLHFYVTDKKFEVLRLATHPDHLRQGTARTLLFQLENLALEKEIEQIFLKVDEAKAPAQELYKSCGYERNPKKDETWLSKYF